MFSLRCSHLFSEKGSAATDKYKLPFLKTEWLLMEKGQLCKNVIYKALIYNIHALCWALTQPAE